MQAAMRGLVGAPWGKCSIPGHGYTYAPRGKRPNGCLVPGCRGSAAPLEWTLSASVRASASRTSCTC